MEPEKLKEVLELHASWLKREIGGVSANLSGVDLRETDLLDANFRRANLKEANLRGADLRGANLSWTYFHGATLDKKGLMHCILQEVYVNEVVLIGENQ